MFSVEINKRDRPEGIDNGARVPLPLTHSLLAP